jgi:hypothetical protein
MATVAFTRTTVARMHRPTFLFIDAFSSNDLMGMIADPSLFFIGMKRFLRYTLKDILFCHPFEMDPVVARSPLMLTTLRKESCHEIPSLLYCRRGAFGFHLRNQLRRSG